MLARIVSLKDRGNDAFNRASRMSEDAFGYESLLQNACSQYGESLQSMLEYEVQGVAAQDESQFTRMKMIIFLNLAMANLKLKNFDGCRKCCNVCLLFCTKPYLLLQLYDSELAVSLNDGEDIIVKEDELGSINSDYIDIAVKALYRRGKALENELSNTALVSYQLALLLSPKSELVLEALSDLKNKVGDHPETVFTAKKVSLPTLEPLEIAAITVNGGRLSAVDGYWSQNKVEAKLTVSLDGLVMAADRRYRAQVDSSTVPYQLSKVEFEEMSLRIFFNDSCLFDLELEYTIIPDLCSWQVGKVGASSTDEYLIIFLSKQKSFEQFEGCEYWDRVFRVEDPIATTDFIEM